MSKRRKGTLLVHFRKKCIGCGACVAVAPELWSLSDSDGLADLKDGQEYRDHVRGTIHREDEDLHREAAEACPVHIIKLE